MTKIKFCGLTRPEDIEAANRLQPDYVGFVFAQKSRRRVSPEQAATLKYMLRDDIRAVGVFVDQEPEWIARLLSAGVIDLAQLHGTEDAEYICRLRKMTGKPIIQAFRIGSAEDVRAAEQSPADYILLDSGAGTGNVFDWTLLCGIRRRYFLAGGLAPENVRKAIRTLHPFAVDVSSGIESKKVKDREKMTAFAAAVRKEGTP